MRTQYGLSMIGLVALIALLVGPWHAWAADKGEGTGDEAQVKSESKVVTVVVGEGEQEDKAQPFTVRVEAVKPGKYWIGVVCQPLQDELVQKVLGIDGGLLIERVVEQSPAAKAGLEKMDILIQAAGQPVEDVATLVEAIEKAEGKPVTLSIFRKGKKLEVTVTPAEREESIIRYRDKEADAEWKTLEETLKKYGLDKGAPDKHGLDKGSDDAQAKRFYFVMPGLAFPEGSKPFPKDLEVNITKKGDDPVRIIVKSGDKKWEVDENSLDELPDSIRPHVRRMLGKRPGGSLGAALELDLKPELLLRRKFEFKPELQLKLDELKLDELKLKDLKLKRLKESLPKELSGTVNKQLEQVQKQLEAQEKSVSPEVLKKIQRQLQEVRAQLEELRKQQQTDDE